MLRRAKSIWLISLVRIDVQYKSFGFVGANPWEPYFLFLKYTPRQFRDLFMKKIYNTSNIGFPLDGFFSENFLGFSRVL
jgi:hypothetical protein